jgi:MoaA/NifB/PqqE/SkfB family radical SAM enzyme
MRREIEYGLKLLFATPSRRPRYIRFEISNACNLSCPMCPRHSYQIKNEHMNSAIAYNICEQLEGDKNEIVLTGWGEPLLHPDFFAIMDTIRKFNSRWLICFTTNGALLNSTRAERLGTIANLQVTVSLDSLYNNGDDRYAGHVGGTDVSRNVETLAEVFRRNPGYGQQVVVQCVIQQGFEADLTRIISWCSEAGVGRVNLVRFEVRNTQKGERLSLPEEKDFVRRMKVLGKEKGVSVSCANQMGMMARIATHNDRLCPYFVDAIYVNVDGEVSPCCQLRDISFGNINHDPLAYIWEEGFKVWRKNPLRWCGDCDAMSYLMRK